jgi:hypothetical protein
MRVLDAHEWTFSMLTGESFHAYEAVFRSFMLILFHDAARLQTT